MNIFEYAARHKVRFTSPRGNLTVEQLFDLPLVDKRGGTIDLETVARTTNGELREIGEESFVSTSPDPLRAVTEIKMEIIKYVIAAKQADVQRAVDAAKRASIRARVSEAIAKKEDAAFDDMSVDDLRKQLAELDA